MIPNVDAVVDVTVMRVLLFVLHMCVLRESDGAKVTEMLVWTMEEVWLSGVLGMWIVHVV